MADIAQTITYNTGPTITFTITYETQRSGNTVSVRFKTVSSTLTGSSFYGYNIQGQCTTNGTQQAVVQIKAASPNQWSTPITTYFPSSTGWYTFTVAPADTTAPCSIRFYSTNGGSVNATASGTVSFPVGYTNPVRGNVTLSPTGVFETVTISWNSFQNGSGNPIARYEVWYQQSSDNSTWAARVEIADFAVSPGTTSGSYQWSGGTRGYYYRFNVIAVGTVANTYSNTETYTSSVRKNRAPNVPGNIRYNSPTAASNGTTSSTKLYIPEDFAYFIWDAASDPDGQSVTYEIQAMFRNSANTEWEIALNFTSSSNTASYNLRGEKRGDNLAIATDSTSLWYRVRAKDSMGVTSAWSDPYHAYKRNPTVVNVGVNGSWIKAEIYAGANGAWKPGIDKDYTVS